MSGIKSDPVPPNAVPDDAPSPQTPPPTVYPGDPPPSSSPKAVDNHSPQLTFKSPPLNPYRGTSIGMPQLRQDGLGGAECGEDPAVKRFDFSDKSIRRGFIRKVYSLLMCQLGLTMAIIAWFLYKNHAQMYVEYYPYLIISSLIFVVAAMICISCSDLHRQAPMNFICLAFITVSIAYPLGITASRFERDEVLMAVGITAAVCLALTLFAFQTTYDFTMHNGIIVVAMVIVFIFTIVALFITKKIIRILCSSLVAFFFSVVLIYKTQLIMGGEHQYSISPEEYIFATLRLYLDIVNIFIYVLGMLGAARR